MKDNVLEAAYRVGKITVHWVNRVLGTVRSGTL